MNDELLRALEAEVRKLTRLTHWGMACRNARSELGAGLVDAMEAIDRMQFLIDRHFYRWSPVVSEMPRTSQSQKQPGETA